MNILYIEDEPLDAQLVERYLQTTQHKLIYINSLDNVRDVLKVEPDLILMDVMLNNVKSGYDFVDDLRKSGHTLPIIAVTGLALPEDIERCFRVGFTDVLAKPFTLKQLAAVLNNYANKE